MRLPTRHPRMPHRLEQRLPAAAALDVRHEKRIRLADVDMSMIQWLVSKPKEE